MFTCARGVKNLLACIAIMFCRTRDKARPDKLKLITELVFSFFYFNIIMATRSDRLKHRSVIQVALILFQIGTICSVLNFWDQRPCRCMETCYVAQKGYLSALHFWAYTLQVVNILLFPKWNQHPCSHHSSEIHILIYFDLKSRFLT